MSSYQVQLKSWIVMEAFEGCFAVDPGLVFRRRRIVMADRTEGLDVADRAILIRLMNVECLIRVNGRRLMERKDKIFGWVVLATGTS